MPSYKCTAQGQVEMTPEEEAEFEASRAPTTAEIIRKHNAPILAQLAEVDRKSIRAIRDGDAEWIETYKQQAEVLRAQLQ